MKESHCWYNWPKCDRSWVRGTVESNLRLKNWYLLFLLEACHVNEKEQRLIDSESGPSWSWLYRSWMNNYLHNPCLSPLMLWIRIPFRQGVLDTILCDKVCQWLATGWWFSPGTPVSSTNKTDHHDITEILLKVALNTITSSLRIGIVTLLVCPREAICQLMNYCFSELM
jgi:hypothetical protein